MSPDSNSDRLKTELTLALPGHTPKPPTKRSYSDTVEATQPPTSKAQVVGWPPVRTYRKNMTMRSGKFVKVAVDGAPYLRKVDLQTYNGYQELLSAFEDMFTCLNICEVLKERNTMECENGAQYVPTYEDKDGDWMLVGDVPWKMFVESCKRLRLMKSSKAIGLAASKATSSEGSN